ncbi:MAG: UDP-N-acetylglucosamine 2-epimerase [Chitinivibrionales bacterium]
MIHILIGTRAQLIKMVPVMIELSRRAIAFNFVFMAQHRSTIYEIIQQFGIKTPDYVLCDRKKDIVKTGQMIVWSIQTVIIGFIHRKKIFKNDTTGIVLVHGDAPPLFLGSLIAKFQGLKVAAVEAGLRSFNFMRPFPEELVRVVTARANLIDIFFCQDTNALKNVSPYKKNAVLTYGNTIYDTLSLTRHSKEEYIPAELPERFAIVTIHRYETITHRQMVKKIVTILDSISKKIPLAFILHPPTRESLMHFSLLEKVERNDNIVLLPRMDFLSFHGLMKSAQFVITDGGSNQEESAYMGVPCLLMRSETERMEGIGKNVVVSHCDMNIIGDFLDHYKEHRIKTVLRSKTPTQIIVDSVAAFQ